MPQADLPNNRIGTGKRRPWGQEGHATHIFPDDRITPPAVLLKYQTESSGPAGRTPTALRSAAIQLRVPPPFFPSTPVRSAQCPAVEPPAQLSPETGVIHNSRIDRRSDSRRHLTASGSSRAVNQSHGGVLVAAVPAISITENWGFHHGPTVCAPPDLSPRWPMSTADATDWTRLTPGHSHG